MAHSSARGANLGGRQLDNAARRLARAASAALACLVLASCGGSSDGPAPAGPTSSSGGGTAPAVSAFTAQPMSIHAGSSTTLSWTTSGATSIAIAPGAITSTTASGSVSVSPTATTNYTLSATNSAGVSTATLTVIVTSLMPGGPLALMTTSCPGATQGAVYAGCALAASGGTPPYTFSVAATANNPPLPEGMTLNAASGEISAATVGGQGSYGTVLL